MLFSAVSEFIGEVSDSGFHHWRSCPDFAAKDNVSLR